MHCAFQTQFKDVERLLYNMNLLATITKNFKNIREMQKTLKDNKGCIKFLEALIWDGVPVSPFDKTSKVYKCKNGRYRCKNSKKYFTVTTGTIFEGTKIELIDWFTVIYLLNAQKSGVSSTTVARMLGITQKTAWYMLQKIRSAMQFENEGKLSGIVEVDEYYAGGSLKNMHYGKKLEVRARGTYQNKIPVQGFVERGGNAIIKIITNTEMATLCAGVLRYVRSNSTLYSDENQSYNNIDIFYNHRYVTHSKGKYVVEDEIHTTSIESVWAVFDRTLKIHIKVSKKHIQNYAHEATFRYNTRKMMCGDATIWLLQNIESTRITWKDIRDGKYRQFDRNQKRAA